MIINFVCAVLLLSLRNHGSALTRAHGLLHATTLRPICSSSPLGVITIWWFNPWPDIVVGLVVAVINLGAAKEVLEAAQAEDPELELDE